MRMLELIAFICSRAEPIHASEKVDDTKDGEYFTSFAVNTEAEIASKVGKGILLAGGNAIDAAISSAICIGVVNCFSSGIGGGGFMLIRKKEAEKETFDMIDFREVAPAGMDQSMFLEGPELSKTTGLSVGVPGEIMGFYQAHRKYGKLPWKRLFKECIELAKGFPASKLLVQKLERNIKYIQEDDGLRETFMRNGRVIEVGDIVSRHNYARTLEEISEDPLSFYSGSLSQKIVEFINKNRGVFDIADLNNYEAKSRPVITDTFYDYKVYTTGLPTSGIFIIEALKALERINIRGLRFLLGKENAFYLYHILIEVFKFTIASRGEFGDPDFLENWKRKVSMVISEAKARQISRKLRLDSVLEINEYGAKTSFKEDHGTTHLNVVDQDENIVSMTTTINLEFGAKLMDPDTGIIFNNQMDDFYIPGVDSAYGLAEMPANIISKGKRPFSSASPTILIKNDEIIVIGAAGGIRIPSAIIASLAHFMTGSSLSEAIASCRIHNQLFPAKTFIEPSLPESIINSLQSLGHEVEVSELNTSFTSVQAIQMKKNDGRKAIYAISDSRKDGASDGI